MLNKELLDSKNIYFPYSTVICVTVGEYVDSDGDTGFGYSLDEGVGDCYPLRIKSQNGEQKISATLTSLVTFKNVYDDGAVSYISTLTTKDQDIYSRQITARRLDTDFSSLLKFLLVGYGGESSLQKMTLAKQSPLKSLQEKYNV